MNKKQFVVIGIGRFGASVARTLYTMGYDVMAIDIDEEVIEEMKDEVTYGIAADAQETRILESLGVRNLDVAVVAVGNDIQASILISLALQEIGVPKVVAKAIDDRHGRLLEKLGVDKIIYPERDMGERLAHYLVSTNLLDYIAISDKYSLSEVIASDRLINKTLKETNLRVKYGVNVIALKRGERLIISPPGEEFIKADDVLICIGKTSDMDKFALM
ncbi:MAG: TrkA family potassium uptake protein [Syntrophomonadaceae bacterium]|nr:TrkA family potassium uptake protein [Syntrophomonadaceae bacterium]